jgi:AraC-like DNA-binding protein
MNGTTLNLASPPYQSLEPISVGWAPAPRLPGCAIVWNLCEESLLRGELEWILERPRGLGLVIVLPPAENIGSVARYLPRLSNAFPRAVLPSGPLATPPALDTALSLVPRNLPLAVTEYLARYSVVRDRNVLSEIRRVFELAPRTPTIALLCRHLYTSRRTLGRHFEACRLPVPSHWLQFARLLYVILKAQSEPTAIFRLATRAGYPDGFTLSNQMRRLIGWRPSELRSLYGFEWIMEEWLERERNRSSA